MLGVSTALCALAALLLRLNMPAIQLVNYLLTPLQLLLIIPLLRFGELLADAPRFPVTLESGLELLSHGVIHAIQLLATAIVHATLGWLVLAPVAGFRAVPRPRTRLPPLTSRTGSPMTSLAMRLLERDLVPDFLIRRRIRSLLGVAPARRRPARPRETATAAWPISSASSRPVPVAIETAAANEQHYEVPTEFYTRVLGKHLKYSSCYLPASQCGARARTWMPPKRACWR